MKILEIFGLTTLKKYDEKVDELVLAIARQNIAETKLNNVFAENKPTVEFATYRKELGRKEFDREFWDVDWYAYYDKYHRDEYEAYKIRNLSKHPHLLNAFLCEFGSYDWNRVEAYMKKVDWKWSDKSHTPTVEELKDAVITLIPFDGYESNKNMVQSGGFSLSLFYKEDGSPYCKIDFAFNYNNI